jgi:mRNA interferase HicA
VKRRELIEKIGRAARDADLSWDTAREGQRHEIWRCGTTRVSIPRHRQINERTAEGIFKDLEDELGRRWWQ